MFNTAVGIGFSVVLGTIGLRAVLPEPPAMVVNALTMNNGMVTQDRTITTTGDAFYMQWAATVVNVDTGESIHWCEGRGANAYGPGRKAVEFTLPEWTGSATCTLESLPPGQYILRAAWMWGNQNASARSNVFEVRP